MMCLTLLFPVQLRQGNEYVNEWMQTKVVLRVLGEKDNAAAGLTSSCGTWTVSVVAEGPCSDDAFRSE